MQRRLHSTRCKFLCMSATLGAMVSVSHAQVDLSDQPVSTSRPRLANIALTPSVEFPTAINSTHTDFSFNPLKDYAGYFDINKCYSYDSAKGYFKPAALASINKSGSGAITQRTCSNKWSGNLLNYATMQTIDIFRLAMTGGSRWVDGTVNYDLPINSADTANLANPITVLRRAFHSSQGGSNNFRGKILPKSLGISNYVSTGDLGTLNTNQTLGFFSRTNSAGFGFSFKVANLNDTTPNNDPAKIPATTVTFNSAVEVCNTSVGLESNCVKYKVGNNEIYKPEGLLQRYKSDFRFSVFSYYNRRFQTGSSAPYQDGGVMRAPMKYVDTEVSDTGAFISNPDAVFATASGVSNSGIFNYINLFGYAAGSYRTYDSVSELYAEALRYFQGASGPSPTSIVSNPTNDELEGFPAVLNWTPYPAIKNYCDQNFFVGIGDVNTHSDRHMTGGPIPLTAAEPTTAAIDVGFNVPGLTDSIGAHEGMGNLGQVSGAGGDGTGYDFNTLKSGTQNPGGSNNSFYMAGLAYWANTNDVNPNIQRVQTVKTYWVDILEFGAYKHRNIYWLAAK
jgi:type IV pilus assembly protein PilY1